MTLLTSEADQTDLLSATRTAPDGLPRDWTFVNWAAALLTAIAAAFVMKFGLAAVAGKALCSSIACPDLGTQTSTYHVLYFGAPIAGALTLLISLATATHRRGIIVPLLGAAFLAVDWALLVTAF